MPGFAGEERACEALEAPEVGAGAGRRSPFVHEIGRQVRSAGWVDLKNIFK
jgi:hypothetical protein